MTRVDGTHPNDAVGPPKAPCTSDQSDRCPQAQTVAVSSARIDVLQPVTMTRVDGTHPSDAAGPPSSCPLSSVTEASPGGTVVVLRTSIHTIVAEHDDVLAVVMRVGGLGLEAGEVDAVSRDVGLLELGDAPVPARV